jgi:hypothetical protein
MPSQQKLPRDLINQVAPFLNQNDITAFVWSSKHMKDLLAPLHLVVVARIWKPQVIKPHYAR